MAALKNNEGERQIQITAADLKFVRRTAKHAYTQTNYKRN